MARASKQELLARRKAAAQALAEQILALDAARPATDRDREERAFEAIADAESIDEAWELLIARSIIPESWIDASHRRFYAMSNRCARCGHPLRCRFARCLHDERKEPLYAFGHAPGSLWDLLVVAGHIQRFIDAEAEGEERERAIRSPMSSPTRVAWTFEIATPQPLRLEALSRMQGPIVRLALSTVEARTGRPFEYSTSVSGREIIAWLDANSEREGDAMSAVQFAPPVQFLGQTCGWSGIRMDLAPTTALVQRLPRALPLTR